MESHGQSGIIQITRATCELIRDEFVCDPQGTVSVKGKGEMEAWHVTGKRPGSPGHLPEQPLQGVSA